MRTKVSIAGLCFLLSVGLTIQLNMPQVTQALQSIGDEQAGPAEQEDDQGLGALAGNQYPFQYVWRSQVMYPLRKSYISNFDGDPAVADLDQDGYLDVVVAHSTETADANYVSAYCGKDGRRMWEFGPIGGTQPGAPMIEDVNGDGLLEVVFGDDKNTLYCVSGPFGSLVWKKVGYRMRNSVAFFDVNKDGRKDIIVAARDPTGPDGNVTALDGQAGEVIWVSTAKSWYKFSPTVCDIDGDGKYEVVAWVGDPAGTTPRNTYVMNAADGTLKWNITGAQGGGLVIDINSDGVLDFISYVANETGSWACAYAADLEALAKDNTAPAKYLWTRPGADTGGGNNEMVVGDLNGDGVYEFVHVQEVVPAAMYNILCRRLIDGEILWNASAPGMYPKYANSALGDYDNDGLPDVAVTSGYKSTAPTFNVFRGTDGSTLLSIPMSSMSGPAIADVNNDGSLEVIVSGVAIVGGAADEGSYIWALPTTTRCDTGQVAWGMHLYDHANSGILPIAESAGIVVAIVLLGISVKRGRILRRK